MANDAEAALLAERVLRWLIDEQIVVAERTDCIMGDGGHAPGLRYIKTTESSDLHFLKLRTNGVEIVSTHTIFHNGGLGFEIVCSSCGGRFEPLHARWVLRVRRG